jgi:membrane-bound lytic murein transglycosylase D
VRGWAYHRPQRRAGASSITPPIELRVSPPLLVLVIALALAACATPDPGPAGAPEPEQQAAAPAPADPPPIRATPLERIPDVFPPEISAELEPLPPPENDLWDRIRAGCGMPDITGPDVEKWEEWYSSRPDYVARMVERSRRYLYYIVVEVERRGMPAEIALLPMIESAYNPVAMSSARASGIWQFTPRTGKDYGLKQNFWYDSRRDVIAATDGALTYLQKLYDQFGDWQLALAAYNWGEGNVARAIERNEKAGKPTDYASLSMPEETRNYLPKLQAVKNIIADPGRFGLDLADIPDAPYFAVVKTTRQMDVKRAADLAEMSVEEFQYLNPHHNRPVIAGADEYAILLPIDKAELFAAKLELSNQPLVSWQAYRLRPGESMKQVAARFGMSVQTLLAVNGIGARARVPAGHMLLVPSQRPSAETAASLKQAVFTTVPQGRTFYYRVNRGDTLSGIAARYSVGVEDLRRWNHLTHSTIRVGQQLRVVSDRTPSAGSAKRAAGGKGKSRAATAKSSSPRTKARSGTKRCCAKRRRASGRRSKRTVPAAHR